MSSTASKPPIVLIHGMWMTPLSWEHWASHYTDRGHHVVAPAWPGLDKEPEQLRRDPAPLRGIDITEVVDHYDKIIRGLDQAPIIIGHSFGGLFTQLLLDRGLGVAGVTLGTAAPKGVLKLPFSTLRSAWPALGNPANLKKETPLTTEQFHWCFTNAVSKDESDRVYDRYYIPGARGRSSRRASRTSTRTARRRSTTRTPPERRFCSSRAPSIGSVRRR